MREIKFRGIKENGEWVFGFYYAVNGFAYISRRGEIDDKGFAPMLRSKVDPATVGQSTGLKDKNCVEIFEGDVAIYDIGDVVYTGCVSFDTVGAYWRFTFETTDVNGNVWREEFDFSETQGDEYQVTGNIHDETEQK